MTSAGPNPDAAQLPSGKLQARDPKHSPTLDRENSPSLCGEFFSLSFLCSAMEKTGEKPQTGLFACEDVEFCQSVTCQ